VPADHSFVLVAGSGLWCVAEGPLRKSPALQNPCRDDAGLEHGLAKNLTAGLMGVARDFSHILAPATTFGRTSCARAPRCLMSQQDFRDQLPLKHADTRAPIYAGNAMATVESSDAVKVITVRATTFDPVSRRRQRHNPKRFPRSPTKAFRPSSNWPNPIGDRPELTSRESSSRRRGMASGAGITPCFRADRRQAGRGHGASRAASMRALFP